MRYALIDDLRVPGDPDNKKAIPVDAVVARNYADGLRLLQQEHWDVLYLDHDLADFSGPTGRELTGYDVLCFLEECPEHLPGNIIIVSDNASGMQRMRMVIAKLYGCPY